MTYQDDRNLDRDPVTRAPVHDEGGFGWGIPLALAAVVLIAGLLFFNSNRDMTTATNNNSPTTNQSVPAPAAPTITPAPAPAPIAPRGG